MGVERNADKMGLRWSMTVGCLLDPNSPAAKYASKSVLRRGILGCGLLVGEGKATLVISDLHLPYQHRDAFAFLEALSEYYDFGERVLNVGDLYDHHRGSYHESEPGSWGEEEEYKRAKKSAHILQDMFPSMTVVEGNHDAIPQRKLKSCGLPVSMLSDYNSMYDTHDGWVWKDEHFFDSEGQYPITVPMVLNKRGRWDKNILRI